MSAAPPFPRAEFVNALGSSSSTRLAFDRVDIANAVRAYDDIVVTLRNITEEALRMRSGRFGAVSAPRVGAGSPV